MGDLVFVCPWPVWVSLPCRRGEAQLAGERWGEGFLHFHSLSWEWEIYHCPLYLDVDRGPASPARFKVAESRFELGDPVPNSLGQKQPWQGFCVSAPDSLPPLFTVPTPPFQPWTAFLRVEDVDRGLVDTRTASCGAWHAGGVI